MRALLAGLGALAFVLAACGDRDAEQSGSQQPATVSATSTPVASTPTRAPAATGTPIPLTVTQPANCSPAYPDFCIPPPPPDLDCRDFTQKRFRALPPDPHNLDNDNDGIACES